MNVRIPDPKTPPHTHSRRHTHAPVVECCNNAEAAVTNSTSRSNNFVAYRNELMNDDGWKMVPIRLDSQYTQPHVKHIRCRHAICHAVLELRSSLTSVSNDFFFFFTKRVLQNYYVTTDLPPNGKINCSVPHIMSWHTHAYERFLFPFKLPNLSH